MKHRTVRQVPIHGRPRGHRRTRSEPNQLQQKWSTLEEEASGIMIPQQSATKSERGQVARQHHGFVSLNPKALFASSCIEQALEVPWHTVVLAGAWSE